MARCCISPLAFVHRAGAAHPEWLGTIARKSQRAAPWQTHLPPNLPRQQLVLFAKKFCCSSGPICSWGCRSAGTYCGGGQILKLAPMSCMEVHTKRGQWVWQGDLHEWGSTGPHVSADYGTHAARCQAQQLWSSHLWRHWTVVLSVHQASETRATSPSSWASSVNCEFQLAQCPISLGSGLRAEWPMTFGHCLSLQGGFFAGLEPEGLQQQRKAAEKSNTRGKRPNSTFYLMCFFLIAFIPYSTFSL